MAIDSDKLKEFLTDLVDQVLPHKKGCNLVRDNDACYGVGCTCGIDDKVSTWKQKIEELEEDPSDFKPCKCGHLSKHHLDSLGCQNCNCRAFNPHI
jgi:hypothetical protein